MTFLLRAGAVIAAIFLLSPMRDAGGPAGQVEDTVRRLAAPAGCLRDVDPRSRRRLGELWERLPEPARRGVLEQALPLSAGGVARDFGNPAR